MCTTVSFLCLWLCVCLRVQGSSGWFIPEAACDGRTSALSLPERKRSDLCIGDTDGVWTYINVICINVIWALLPLLGLQSDTGVIIWKSSTEEKNSSELVVLTRTQDKKHRQRDNHTVAGTIRDSYGVMWLCQRYNNDRTVPSLSYKHVTYNVIEFKMATTADFKWLNLATT